MRLRSHATCINQVELYVREIFAQYKLDPELFPNILISLTEAVNNAVQHGNQNDATKIVRVCIRKRQDHLHCEVSDEGGGFDPRAVPDPTAPENIENPGGRGVFLMRQLADKMQYKDNGSTVELMFYLQ